MYCLICGCGDLASSVDVKESSFYYTCQSCGAVYSLVNKEYSTTKVLSDAFRDGKRIVAIETIRLLTGCDLRTAKIVYEAAAAKNSIPF